MSNRLKGLFKACIWVRTITLLILLIKFSVLQAQYKTKYVVAQDGSGDYKTIQEVIKVCKAFPDERIFIHIKPGIYREKVEVYSWTTRISLIGENAETTIITFDDYSGKGDITTFTSFTVKIMGNDFTAENITFENAAGPVGQAVALHVEADRCIFKNCRFLGNQDTIYAAGERRRQYFLNSYIEGTTDFIFGSATAVFEKCELYSKKNSYITAASTTKEVRHGFVFLQCKLRAAPGVDKVFLGRPWRNDAKTVFIQCEMGDHIVPEGWHNWNKPDAEKTSYYGEYKNSGDGYKPHQRVKWSHQLEAWQASEYSVKRILGDWVI